MKSIARLFVLSLLLPGISLAQKTDSLEARADTLYKQHQEKQALELYQQILEQDPDNYEALWKSSFLYSRIGHRFEDEDKQEQYFNKGIELAKRALEVNPDDSQSNFVMSVAMGRKALISGAKDSVAASREIKKYADRAIELDSTNAGAWHVLGRWNFKVANLSWLERAAANTLFGGISGKASNKKAAKAIRKAIQLDENYIFYYYDLARIYEEMGRDARAIETCQQAIELPSLTPDGPGLKKKCQELIQDI